MWLHRGYVYVGISVYKPISFHSKCDCKHRYIVPEGYLILVLVLVSDMISRYSHLLSDSSYPVC